VLKILKQSNQQISAKKLNCKKVGRKRSNLKLGCTENKTARKCVPEDAQTETSNAKTGQLVFRLQNDSPTLEAKNSQIPV